MIATPIVRANSFKPNVMICSYAPNTNKSRGGASFILYIEQGTHTFLENNSITILIYTIQNYAPSSSTHPSQFLFKKEREERIQCNVCGLSSVSIMLLCNDVRSPLQCQALKSFLALSLSFCWVCLVLLQFIHKANCKMDQFTKYGEHTYHTLMQADLQYSQLVLTKPDRK